MKQQNAKIGG